MKKLQFIFLFLLGSILYVNAQSTINFQAMPPVEGDMSAEVSNALKLKVEQILTRNGAAATSLYNAFVVEPQLNLLEEMSTEGLIRNVNLVKAELTLLAKNALDGSMYGSIVVPIAGSGKGSMDQTLRSLIANIKVTDSQYSRFIRNARQKITDHYTQNCGTIMQKAQVMMNTGKYEDAVAYLSCVPETTPCYEQAAEALVQASGLAKNMDCEAQILVARNYYIRHEYEKALDILTKIPMSSDCNNAARALTDSIEKYINIPPETIQVEKVVEKEVIKEVPVEKIVEKEVIKEVPVEKIVVKQVPAAVQQKPAVSALNPKITYSASNLQVKILSCEGIESQQTVVISFVVTNTLRSNSDRAYWYYLNGIDTEGNSYERATTGHWEGSNYNDSSKDLPYGVPVKWKFYLTKVYEKVPGFSYLKFKIRDCEVTIKDLPITWKP